MKCVSVLFVSFACAICAGIPTLAAAENTPPPPTLVSPSNMDLPSRTATVGPAAKPNGQVAAEPLHDPTRPSPLMKQLIGPVKLPGQSKAPEVPTVDLKSRIIGRNQPGVAVLEIDKQTYTVGKGSEFVVTGSKYGGQKIRVVELDADEVRLEIQPANLSVTLR